MSADKQVRRRAEELVITREFDAPRDLVFKCWTEPERLAKWWGPKNMTVSVVKIDLKPGGIFHYSMRMADGKTMWGKFVYRSITPPSKLEFVVSFSDENCADTRHPFAPDWPLKTLSTIELSEVNGKTLMTMTAVPIDATDLEVKTFTDGHGSMQQGWKGTLERLTDYLASAK